MKYQKVTIGNKKPKNTIIDCKPKFFNATEINVQRKKLNQVTSYDIQNEVNPLARNQQGLKNVLEKRAGKTLVKEDADIVIVEFDLPDEYTPDPNQ